MMLTLGFMVQSRIANKLYYPEFWFSLFQTPFLGSFSFPHHLWKQGGHTAKQGLNSLFCITPLILQEPNPPRFPAHPNHNRDNPICIVIFHYLITNASLHNWSRTLSFPCLFCYLWDISLKALNCIYRAHTALWFLYLVACMKPNQRCSRQAGSTSMGNSS